MPYISLLILTFFNRCILVKTSLINTKLGNIVSLGVLFLTMWINSCLSHNENSYLVLHGLKSGNDLELSFQDFCKKTSLGKSVINFSVHMYGTKFNFSGTVLTYF